VVVKDFDKLQPDDETMRLREDLLTNVDQIADEKAISGDPTKEHIKEMIRSYTWVQKYERLKELANTMRTDYYLTEDEITEIQLLFSKEMENKRKNILKSHEVDLKDELLKKLRENNIYVLSKGSVESYYPQEVTGRDKVSKAFNVCKVLTEPGQITDLCPQLEDGGSSISEFELIFEKYLNRRNTVSIK